MDIYTALHLFLGLDLISTDSTIPPNSTPVNVQPSLFIAHWKLILGSVPHSEVEISGEGIEIHFSEM